jgi:hypothetical protein
MKPARNIALNMYYYFYFCPKEVNSYFKAGIYNSFFTPFLKLLSRSFRLHP